MMLEVWHLVVCSTVVMVLRCLGAVGTVKRLFVWETLMFLLIATSVGFRGMLSGNLSVGLMHRL